MLLTVILRCRELLAKGWPFTAFSLSNRFRLSVQSKGCPSPNQARSQQCVRPFASAPVWLLG
jgi:hypothetical protein